MTLQDKTVIERAQAMCERLRSKVHRGQYYPGGGSIDSTGKCTMWGGGEVMEYANQDGPQAASIIEELVAKISAPVEDEGVVEQRWTSAVPMIRRPNGNWSKVHMNGDGTFGPDITPDEADAIGAWRFYLLKPGSELAIAAMRHSQAACSDCGRPHDPNIRCPNFHGGMMPAAMRSTPVGDGG